MIVVAVSRVLARVLELGRGQNRIEIKSLIDDRTNQAIGQ